MKKYPTIMDIEKFCNRILEPEKFEDSISNGIQLETDKPIKKLVSTPSCNLSIFQEAAREGADLILTHHGFKHGQDFWSLRGFRYRRLSPLLKNNIGLLSYHLPLDAHPKLGNNIHLAKILKLTNIKPFSVGLTGNLPSLKTALEISKLFQKAGIKPTHGSNLAKKVKKIAIISGGGFTIIKDNLFHYGPEFDLFITGDPHEHQFAASKEIGYAILTLGHDASETHGVQALGAAIAKKFGIKHKFIPPVKF